MKTNIVILSLALIVAAGCRTVNTVENGEPVAHRKPIADKRVITDESLRRAVHVLGVNSSTGAQGFLRIQIDLQNTTRVQQAFTYRAEWLDENAMVIQLPTANSTPMTLQGMEQSMIVLTAPTPRAKDFRIKFLETMN